MMRAMACVLVVDDDELLRDAVSEAIADAGYEVEQAENGREALDKMRRASPCIVLLDLMMPVMDGWEVVSEMTKDPALASVPVCVVSAQDRIAPPKAVRTLRKPVTAAVLLQTVEQYCGKAPGGGR
jgi:CheY-like chemotaxis protein